MRKNKLLLLLALLMTAATGAWAQEVIPVTLDFTSNTWGFPEGTEEKTAAENSYTSGGYTITLCGSSGNGYYFSLTEPYILLGKQGAYLQLPAFSSAVDSIKVVGSPNASTSVVQNIYVDDNNSWVAVSTPTTGMKNVTQKYVIAENYRAAGNIYFIKVDNNYNTQIKKVLVYFTPATYTVSLKDGVKDADKWTASTDGTNFGALPIGGLKGDGTETVTLKYNGRLKVKGVKATSDAEPAATVKTITIAADFHTSGEIATAPEITIEYNEGEKWSDVAARYDWLKMYETYTVYYDADSKRGDLHTADGGVQPSDLVDPTKSYYWGYE